MKLIFAIVHNDDAGKLTAALRVHKHQFTLISTTGGFLRKGNSTILIGVEPEKLDNVIKLIESNCVTRTQIVNPIPPMMEQGGMYLAQPMEVQVGGATVFVVNVEQFKKL